MVEQAYEFDLVHIVISDYNGVHRGKFIQGCDLKKALKHGSGFPYDIIIVGPNGEVAEKTMKTFSDYNFGNGTINLIKETIHNAPWLSGSGSDVGEVIAELEAGGLICPRSVASKQLASLNQYGCKLYSGFEREFMIKNKVPESEDETDFPFSVIPIKRFQHFIQKAHRITKEAGIETESIYTETGHNQFEFALCPTEGLKSADNSFIFKEIIKCLAVEEDFKVSFLARSNLAAAWGNSSDFNFSFIDDGEGRNLFYDEKNEYQLSEMAKHVLAGLVVHGPALSAFGYPTVNCYRRAEVCPDYSNWAVNDRTVCFRVKKIGTNNIAIENRLCSGAANSYLVMAGTIAAALDGLKRGLVLPEPKSKNAEPLPTSLEMALKHLEEDEFMREALGDSFVDCFVSFKREIDLKLVKSAEYQLMSEEEKLRKEVDFYEYTL